MEDKTAERIFTVIDGVKCSIANVEKLFVAQNEIIKHLSDKTSEFIKKVDEDVFHPESGCMARNKTAIKVQQAKISWQWGLLIIVMSGIISGALATFLKK